jgi:hypothetical protein
VREQVRSGNSPRKYDEKTTPTSSPSGSPRSSNSPRVSKSLRRFTLKRQSSEKGCTIEVKKESVNHEVKKESQLFSDYKNNLLELCKIGDEARISEILDQCTMADIMFVIDKINDGDIRTGLMVRLEYFKNM